MKTPHKGKPFAYLQWIKVAQSELSKLPVSARNAWLVAMEQEILDKISKTRWPTGNSDFYIKSSLDEIDKELKLINDSEIQTMEKHDQDLVGGDKLNRKLKSQTPTIAELYAHQNMLLFLADIIILQKRERKSETVSEDSPPIGNVKKDPEVGKELYSDDGIVISKRGRKPADSSLPFSWAKTQIRRERLHEQLIINQLISPKEKNSGIMNFSKIFIYGDERNTIEPDKGPLPIRWLGSMPQFAYFIRKLAEGGFINNSNGFYSQATFHFRTVNGEFFNKRSLQVYSAKCKDSEEDVVNKILNTN